MPESNLSIEEKLDRVVNGYKLSDLWPLIYPEGMQYKYPIGYMMAHHIRDVRRAVSKNVLILNNAAFKVYEIMKENIDD